MNEIFEIEEVVIDLPECVEHCCEVVDSPAN